MSANQGTKKGPSGADRGTVVITAVSALLAWIGIGLSVYGSLGDAKAKPAGQSGEVAAAPEAPPPEAPAPQ
jgi:hypothetical protein